MLPLLVLVAAQAFDFVSFLAMVGARGLASELNPIVQRIAIDYGLAGITLAKLGVTALATATVIILARTHPRFAVVVFAVGTVGGIIGGMSNLGAL